jgi:hypothetical protein
MDVERSAQQCNRPVKVHEIAATSIELVGELLATIHHVAKRIVLRVSPDAGWLNERLGRAHSIA